MHDPQAVTLAEATAQADTLFAKLPLGIAFFDSTLLIDSANEGFAAAMGIPLATCRGALLDEALPFVASTLAPKLRWVFETGEVIPELEFSASLPDPPDTRRYWLSAIAPTERVDSRVTRVAMVVRDITHRIQARERDQRRALGREGMYALASALVEAETAQDVVRAVVTHATTAFSAAGTVVARCTEDGKWVELLDAEGMPPTVADEWRRFPIDAPVPLSYVARTGESLFLESAADWEEHFPELARLAADVGHPANAILPLVIAGKSVGALGIAFARARTFDAEDRALAGTVARQCALALERARLYGAEHAARLAADAANRTKAKFLATVSHEFRTPLNAIAGYTELLDLEIHGPLTGEQRSSISRIQRSVQHLLGLIGNVLSLLTVESGRLEYHIADVAVEAVLQFVLEATAPQRSAKRLTCDVPSCRGLSVKADAEKLRQILLNLLSNAIKFTDDGGTITIACSATDRDVRVDVSDTGRGIPADQVDRIFDPFVRVDQGSARPTEGTGLGLSISREFARGMNGELSARSTLGVGSTFTLVLPRAD